MNARPDDKTFKNGEPVEGRKVSAPAQEKASPASKGEAAPIGASSASPAPAAPRKKRRPIRKLLIVGLPLVLLIVGGYYWVTGGRYINTEDAYVQQNRVTVMPQVSGRIASVDVAENQHVKAGDLLFTIDDAVYRNAVEQEEANLQAARLDVAKLKANYQEAISAERTARDALANARTQDQRQRTLVGRGYVSQSAADTSNLTLQQAEGAVATAQSRVLGAKAALAGKPDAPVDQHPEVLKALADLHGAELDLTHTKIYAPGPGIVSQTDRLQVGQYVTPAAAVVGLVKTDASWIEANYKETELTNMRAGQPVEVTLDTYPGRRIEATVGSIGAGTGSEFALLPAQNATGNWVKVVQRIPVRIHLDETSDTPPLRAGMSASVTVDTGHSRGVPDVLKPVVTALGLDPYLDEGSRPAVAGSEATPPTISANEKGTLPSKETQAENAALAAKPASTVEAPKVDRTDASQRALGGAAKSAQASGR